MRARARRFRRVSDRLDELKEVARNKSRGRLDLLAYAISPDERWAVTLLQVRDTGYLLDALYEYKAEGWYEHTTGSVGTSYSGIGENEAGDLIGVLRTYGDAPSGSRVALVTWRGTVHEVPVRDGFFVFAVWDARESDDPSDYLVDEVKFR